MTRQLACTQCNTCALVNLLFVLDFCVRNNLQKLDQMHFLLLMFCIKFVLIIWLSCVSSTNSLRHSCSCLASAPEQQSDSSGMMWCRLLRRSVSRPAESGPSRRLWTRCILTGLSSTSSWQWKATGTHILRGGPLDEAQTLLDDHIIKSRAMSASPFAKPFAAEIVPWVTHLTRLNAILEQWLTCQVCGHPWYTDPVCRFME